MESAFEEFITMAKLLGPHAGMRLLIELSEILTLDVGKTLDLLLPISDGTDGKESTLAFEGHRLDMEVDGKPIYDHLKIYKTELLSSYANYPILIGILPSLSMAIRNIKFKMELPPESDLRMEDKIAVTGNMEGNERGFVNLGVSGVPYFRNEGLDQDVREFLGCIEVLIEYGIHPSDAFKIIVLLGGWPKAGFHSDLGSYNEVGEKGWVAFAASRGEFAYGYCFGNNEVEQVDFPSDRAVPSLQSNLSKSTYFNVGLLAQEKYVFDYATTDG